MKKILIVEDDRILMETTSDFLTEEGYEVIQAVDGSEGIAMAERHLPDLILCDISMPVFDGYQVFSKLQGSFATARIPFIFMTARSDREDFRQGMQMGADDYITKPVNFRELQQSIRIRLDKVERTIRKSEAKYRALFQLARDSIVIINPKTGQVRDVNQACLEITGYAKEVLLGENGYELLTRKPWSATLELIDKEIVRPDVWYSTAGVEIPVQVSATLLEISGEEVCMLSVRNNTELYRKEVALRESEERYRELVENTGEGLGAVDTEEIFTYANPAACEIFGIPHEQMIGSSLFSHLDPTSAEQVRIQTTLRKEGEKSMYELEINRPDGSKRWIMVTASPQFDNRGKFTGTFGIFRDITKRKNAEIRLRESEERLREIVDLTSDWIWEINPSWQYQYVSPRISQILGYTREEMLGKTPFDFILPEDVEQIKGAVRELVHQFKPLTGIEARAIHKTGSIVYLETSGVPIFDSKGKYAGYRGADRDITLRKLYEKELIVSKEKAEESDRLKSSILANISHELRTPLNGILGFSEILQEELKDTEHFPMTQNIHLSGQRLMITLNSIITLSQLEAGKITINMKTVNLCDSVMAEVRTMLPNATEKGIGIEITGLNSLLLHTDDHLVRQLLRQLIDNAIKFTETGGVSIHLDRKMEEGKEWVTISVSDTGIGIPKEYFELIFQEFRQVSEGFGRQYQGSGIGLTICKKIIDLLGGKITVESQPGKGSSFRIWIPEPVSPGAVLQADQPEPDIKKTAPVTEERGEKPCLLMVEDNQVNKDLTQLFLRKSYIVDFASSGEMALEMAKKRQYAAILMDINLGFGMTGLEAARELRKVDGYKTTPIIAVTGYTLIEDQDKFREAGCTHYIAKPYSQQGLMKLIHEALYE